MTARPKVRFELRDERDLQRELEVAERKVAELEAALDSSETALRVLLRHRRDPLAQWKSAAASLLATGRAHIPGVGAFHATTRKARRVRNPATGELMMLPETKSVRFKPSKGGVFG
jgi:hypothetical protein